MSDLLSLGQWQGFFTYGPEYGDTVHGQEVEFRLFIEGLEDGQFVGRVIDWEGFGADGEVSQVKGFIDADAISFIKQYPSHYAFDEDGNAVIEEGRPGISVAYEGLFDHEKNCFSGSWEISVSEEQVGEFLVEEITTGKWRMTSESP